MPVLKSICDFSFDGELFAYSSPDGCLKIWDTSTNTLKQEYTPSAHLSATCSALSWYPYVNIVNPSKRSKKFKDGNSIPAVRVSQLIAMGSLTGDILLYSYVNADLYSCLSNGHASVVNDLCWCVTTSSLYSCSNDKNICVWDIFTGEIKVKWKADSVPVHSLCLIDNDNLLTASSSIKWWNIKQKTVIKTFTGHATEVFKLLPLKIDGNVKNSYFVSAAVGDRIINAWQLNEDNSKRAVASFIVSDEPESISAITLKDGPTFMSVVCKDGSLHIFEHTLSGFKKKSIQSNFSIHVASDSSESHNKPKRVPVLSCTLLLGLSSCLLSYGSFLNPFFEKIDLTEVSTDLFLIRDISLISAHSRDEDVTRIKQTDKSGPINYLMPGHLMPVKGVASIPVKRKKKGDSENELPMEERLRALDLSKIPPNLKDQEHGLKADSMVHLLLQGLQSKDNNLLNTVLQSSDERIIQNTLKRLPLQSIILLLKELQDRLNRKEHRNHPYLRWMKFLLTIHLPYLMSLKDIAEYLGPISELIAVRKKIHPEMCKFQGHLKLLLSQTSVSTLKDVESDEPLAVYQSESSEESDSADPDFNTSDEELPCDVNFEESSSEVTSEDDMDF